MANKSYIKRIKVTKNGKLVARRAGGNHFNGKESRKRQLARNRPQNIILSPKVRAVMFDGK